MNLHERGCVERTVLEISRGERGDGEEFLTKGNEANEEGRAERGFQQSRSKKYEQEC
jgi:hypothetical protein